MKGTMSVENTDKGVGRREQEQTRERKKKERKRGRESERRMRTKHQGKAANRPHTRRAREFADEMIRKPV